MILFLYNDIRIKRLKIRCRLACKRNFKEYIEQPGIILIEKE